MKRITADTASIIVAILRMLVELFRIDSGEQRIVVVLDPDQFKPADLTSIIAASRWHTVIGDEPKEKADV